MDLIIVGAGRAGGSLALASSRAGHRLVGVLSRRPAPFGSALAWDTPLPPSDLVVVAAADSAITEVARRLAPQWADLTPAIHLSGFTSITALEPVASLGVPTGSFHPLQSLPDPERGSRALAGAWAAVTASDPSLAELLHSYATSLAMRPFALADGDKALYHAAASSAANYLVEALGVSADLLQGAHVPFAVMEPLARSVLENVFATDPDTALTGPIARGDLSTVAGQIRAAEALSSSVGRQFRLLAEATAARVGLEL
jgi:predicted short-subunit dehydrogenase-like oxidoreductase (DUF2520 family)